MLNTRPGMDPSLSNQLIEIEARLSNLEDKVSTLLDSCDRRTTRLENTLAGLLKLLAEAMRNDPNVNYQSKYADRIVQVRDQWIKTA